MEKKIYSRPQVKVRDIDAENMLAASDPKTINVTPSDGTINSGRVDAKQNSFFDNIKDDNRNNALNWND